jgi:hypothetical protein
MTSQAQSYASFDPVSEVRRELESTQQQIENAMVDKPTPETTSPPVTAQSDAALAGAEPATAPSTDVAAPASAAPAIAPSTDVAAPSSNPSEPATASADAAKPDGKPA